MGDFAFSAQCATSVPFGCAATDGTSAQFATMFGPSVIVVGALHVAPTSSEEA